jgi:hypothetical protein
MKRTPTNAWLLYALSGLTIVAIVGIVAMLLASRPAAVWSGAGAAYGLQLLTFALLLFVRKDPQLFMVGWLVGLVLRFAVLGVGAYALAKWPVLPRAETLISYVTFVFLLLLLEPLFLRWDLPKQ